MSDRRLRELERRWRATGALADGAAWQRARVRAGVVSGVALRAEAYAGDSSAREALGEGLEHTIPGNAHTACFTANDTVVLNGESALLVCELASGRIVHQLRGPWGYAGWRVVPSRKGAAVLTSAGDDWVNWWEVASGEQLDEREIPRGVTGLAYSPNDSQAAIATGGGVFLLDLDHFHYTLGVLDEEHPYRTVRYSPDGRQVAAGRALGEVEVWDLKEGGSPRVLAGDDGDVDGVAFSPNGELIASAGVDPRIRLWRHGEQVAVLTGHTGPLTALAFNPRVRRLASVGRDGTLRLWDLPTEQEIRCVPAHAGGVTSLQWSKDGARAITAGADGAVRVWRLPGAESAV